MQTFHDRSSLISCGLALGQVDLLRLAYPVEVAGELALNLLLSSQFKKLSSVLHTFTLFGEFTATFHICQSFYLQSVVPG